MGEVKKFGGRPKGAKNRTTVARERALQSMAARLDAGLDIPQAFQGDAHLLLVSVYKDPSIPLLIRIEAARAAIPYEKPRLAPVAPPELPEAVEAKALRLHQLIAEMKHTIGGAGNGHALT